MTLLLAALVGLVASTAALDPIEAYGNKFFNKDGSQFFVKGVAYQLEPHDPLIDSKQCGLDAQLMKELGVNTIRVYHVDATASHDGCMKAFADAGIYLLIDLDTFTTYIEPVHLHWTNSQYEPYTKVMDAFHNYDNVLGFFVGNENIASNDASPAAPFLKAAARDMKAYRNSKGYRSIPIGYSAADIKELRPMLQDYLTCGGNSSEIIDFFGLNSYSWCDPSSFEQSTYNQLQQYAKAFPVPIFFTETGCNVPGPRIWSDQDAIFSKPMSDDWSGAIIYEWIQEQNKYGIVEYGPANNAEGFARSGTPKPKNPDFENLKSKWATCRPEGVSRSAYDAHSVSTRACPSSTPGGWWQIDGNVRLPTLGEQKNGAFTPSPTASKPTSDPTASDGNPAQKPAETNGGHHSDQPNDSDGEHKADGNAASTDRRMAAISAVLAGTVLLVALTL
ncbi:hypothetical protein CDD80_4852 [Ophiocordyceps camponoti-rufipedis]|uniref:1,3-beta-glucanosyltransferase n=1 Tax=Ophiocordyceps camponoti-rufipedis TaxID=2004952 RepID=A0A2C5YR22_9HYPO|nr:hypothetical protein CDD80_4852 [Ophiocordyceps camponoti-rufipedis]